MTELNHHNSKLVWNGKDWMRVPLCDNAYRNTEVNFGHGVGLSPQCYDNEQKWEVTIGYVNCIGDVFEQDTLYLCDECAKLARKAARRDGYKFKSRRL